MSQIQRPVVIRLLGRIDEHPMRNLIEVVDQNLAKGVKNFTLLISSMGGNVFWGLSAYNYLRGIPATFVTHNFGSVDSISTVLYCVGARRLCVPQARFLLHGVTYGFKQGDFEEKQIEETLKSLRIDTENIAKVIAANVERDVKEVIAAMHDRTTLNPDEAKTWKLVHEIKSELYEPGSTVISISTQ